MIGIVNVPDGERRDGSKCCEQHSNEDHFDEQQGSAGGRAMQRDRRILISGTGGVSSFVMIHLASYLHKYVESYLAIAPF